jgi:hypothetical protein
LARSLGRLRPVPGWVDPIVLVSVKLILDVWVLGRGFTHVSDDDYSRTTISELFAQAPRLDPSGTSWLPLPFWVEGCLLALVGRSLPAARAVAIGLGAACVPLPYAAMRMVGMRRGAAVFATTVVMLLPWNAWLGVATVPDGWVGALAAAGVIGALGDRPHRAAWSAALLAVALSRYETWSACAVVALLVLGEAFRARRLRRDVWSVLLCALGPILWMAWNAYAHGSAFHFLARVSAFRRAIGATTAPLSHKLLGYPRALWVDTPEIVVLGVIALIGLRYAPELCKRWGRPALAAAAAMVFLVVGDVGDGAPTHHPARALVMIWWIFAAAGIDTVTTWLARLSTVRPLSRIRSGVAICAGVIFWCAMLPARWAQSPGRTAWDDRRPQIARGLDLRARGARYVTIVPCQFEHFALLAAWGQPERAVVLPRSGKPPGPDCPWVEEGQRP